MENDKIDSSGELVEWLNSIKDNLNGTGLFSALTQITNCVLYYNIAGIVALHYHGELEMLFQKVNEEKSKRVVKQGIQQINQKMEILYHFAYHCFFCEFDQYESVFRIIDKRNQGKADHTKYTGGSDQEYEKGYENMKEILKDYFYIKDKFSRSKNYWTQIDQLIEKTIIFKPSNPYEQLFIIFVRVQIDQIKQKFFGRLLIKNSTICCRVQYILNQNVNQLDLSYQHMFISGNQKTKLLCSPYYRDYFKKLAVSYLNGKGGIIYIGCDSDRNKYTFKGIAMKLNERRQYLSVLMNTFSSIFSTDSDLELKNLESLESNQFNEQQYINKYISVEYLRLYNQETWSYACSFRQTVYVIRIKIRPGHPNQLYYYINEKQTPETLLIQDKSERMLTFQQFHDQYYRRKKLKIISGQLQNDQLHPFCILWKSKINKQDAQTT